MTKYKYYLRQERRYHSVVNTNLEQKFDQAFPYLSAVATCILSQTLYDMIATQPPHFSFSDTLSVYFPKQEWVDVAINTA